MELSAAQFERMCQSLAETTSGTEPNTGISIALWRLRGLLQAAHWALEHGYRFPGDK